MLSREQILRIDPSLAELSEEDFNAIRQGLYDAAQLAWEVYATRKYGAKYPVGLLTQPSKGAIVRAWEQICGKKE